MRKRILIAFALAGGAVTLAAPLTAAAVGRATSIPAACVVVNGPGGATIQAGYAPTGPGGCTQV